MIERRWQLWRRPDSAAADSPKTLVIVIVIVIVIVVGNTHSAGSANGVSDLVGPLEGEWNWWVVLIGTVGHMNWWWCCCNHGIGNIGSFGHIGECMNSRIGMSDHRLVEFEMGHRKKLVAVVVGIGCSHKRSNPLVIELLSFVLRSFWGVMGFYGIWRNLMID